jgi:hypothetical protein
MARLSLRMKVLLAFLTLLCFTLILGGFSIIRIRSLNASTAFLHQNVVTAKPLAVITSDAVRIQALATICICWPIPARRDGWPTPRSRR